MEEYTMNMDAAKRRAEEVVKDEASSGNSSGSNDIEFYNLSVGDHGLRFLPPWSKKLAESGGIDIGVYYHRNLPKGNNVPFKLACPERSFPEENIPCEICRVLNNIHTNSNHDIKHLWPRGRYYTNILPRYTNTKDDLSKLGFTKDTNGWQNSENKVFVLGYPVTVHRWLVKTLVNPMVGNFVSITDGVDISITRTGAGLDTEYFPGNASFRSPISNDPDVVKFVMNGITDLNKIFRLPDDDYLSTIKSTAIAIANAYPSNLASDVVPDRVSENAPVSNDGTIESTVPDHRECTDGQDLFGKYRKEVACTSCLHELECIDASPDSLKPLSGS